MATELSEFFEPAIRFGAMLPLPRLPAAANRALTLDTAYQLGAQTAIVAVLPDADVRIGVGGTAAAAVPTATSLLLKEGVREWFEVAAGAYVRVTAA